MTKVKCNALYIISAYQLNMGQALRDKWINYTNKIQNALMS